MAMSRACLVLATTFLAALTSAERDLEQAAVGSEALVEATGNESVQEFDPPKEVEKLKTLVDAEGSICDSTEIKSLIKGEPTGGTSSASMFKAIQDIPWHTVTSVQESFMRKSEYKISKLTLQGDALRQRIERKKEENAWTPIDEGEVQKFFLGAVYHGFKDDNWNDPEQLAMLTRCSTANRVKKEEWKERDDWDRKWPANPLADPDDSSDASGSSAAGTSKVGMKLHSSIRRLRTIKAPRGLEKTIMNKFKELSVHLYGEEKDASEESGRLYIDVAKFETYCCGLFGLESKCAGISVAIKEKCDDICRECIEDYVKPQNAEQGFHEATSDDSVEEMSRKLENILAEIENLQHERETCTESMEELTAFRKEISKLEDEIHVLKVNFEQCRNSLYDAEEAVDDTADLLDDSAAKLKLLEGALAKSKKAKKTILPLVKEMEAEIERLQKLLTETKSELDTTVEVMDKMTAANNVIVGLKEKVSGLLMQMVTTFETVVGKRIKEAGFESIDFDAVLETFPENIREFEEGAFGTLSDSISGLTGYCNEAENMMKLKDVEDHPTIHEFCSAFDVYNDEKIGGELQTAIQEHIDEFRTWFKKTSDEYKKFKDWMLPSALAEEGKFEPIGLNDVRRHFSETGFFKEYLAKWERETGTFYVAYDKLMESFTNRADRRMHLLLQQKQMQAQLIAQEKKLAAQLKKIKAVDKNIKKVKGVKTKEEAVFKQLEDDLGKLEAEAAEKQKVMEDASNDFEKSWQALVTFHEQKTSLTMLFEDVFKQMKAHHEALLEKMAHRAKPSSRGRKTANRTSPTHEAKAAVPAKPAVRPARQSGMRTLEMHGINGAGKLISS